MNSHFCSPNAHFVFYFLLDYMTGTNLLTYHIVEKTGPYPRRKNIKSYSLTYFAKKDLHITKAGSDTNDKYPVWVAMCAQYLWVQERTSFGIFVQPIPKYSIQQHVYPNQSNPTIPLRKDAK